MKLTPFNQKTRSKVKQLKKKIFPLTGRYGRGESRPAGRMGRPSAGSLHNVGYVKAGVRGGLRARRLLSLIASAMTERPCLIMTSLSDAPSEAATRSWSGWAGDTVNAEGLRSEVKETRQRLWSGAVRRPKALLILSLFFVLFSWMATAVHLL